MIEPIITLMPILALTCLPTLWLIIKKPAFIYKLPLQPNNQKISVIIPARNEEINIPNILTSLTKQAHPFYEILIVDDHSEDQTTPLARQLGAQVIPSKPLPDDWKGKPWACQQGADSATGEWLLFLDADTRLHKNATRYLQTLTHLHQAVFSICPHHQIQKPYEQLSAYFNLLMIAGVQSHTPDNSDALYGQCLFIKKKHYTSVGGHSKVRAEVLENLHLASHLNDAGLTCRSYLGKDIISMRMFPNGITELWNSWKKGTLSGAKCTNSHTLIFSSIWISGMMFSIVSLILITQFSNPTFLILTTLAYCLYVAQTYWAFRLAGNFSFLTSLLYPITLIFYQLLFFSALLDKKRGKNTLWKGRLTD